MADETIQVFYKDTNIDSPEGAQDYYHKYIVYTDDEGNRYYARGGPEWFSNGRFVRLSAEYGEYNQASPDWDVGATDPSETIATGADLSADWQAIKDAIDDINNENWTYWPDRNSNSVVDTALDRAGLSAPTQDDSGEYLSPGSGNILPEEVQTPPVPQPKPAGSVAKIGGSQR